MPILRNKNAPPTADIIQQTLDTAYDKVRAVYDNLADITALAAALDAGSMLTSTDIDTLDEINAILTDATLGDAGDYATAAQGATADAAIAGPIATQGQAEGGTENTKAMTALRVAQAISAHPYTLLRNLSATTDPTVTDDTNSNYAIGSLWINVTLDRIWFCVDNSVGAAIWFRVEPIPHASVNVQTGVSYTILASDNGKEIITTNAGAVAVTLPDGLDTDFQCIVKQAGAGVPTVTPATDTVNGAGVGVTPSAQWKGMHLVKYTATEWFATL